MNHESMGLKSCVCMGATHETCSDVLIHSHNHKVNRACAKSMRQPGMICSSVRVVLNSHPQLQWARSPSHIIERETLLVSPGDQLALTFRLCQECPKEGFWNPLVNQREEVGIQTSSEKRGKRSEFGLLISWTDGLWDRKEMKWMTCLAFCSLYFSFKWLKMKRWDVKQKWRTLFSFPHPFVPQENDLGWSELKFWKPFLVRQPSPNVGHLHCSCFVSKSASWGLADCSTVQALPRAPAVGLSRTDWILDLRICYF